ncbi:MAG: DUF3168 domain-containing protein, partial [Pseudomonadota bacterium]
MSGFALPGAETALQDAILTAVRADAGVKSIFGDPARVFDEPVSAPVYPYAQVSLHELRPGGGADTPSAEHRIDLQVLTRWASRRDAKDAMGVLRKAIEDAEIAPSGYRIVLLFPVFSDVVRLRDGRTLRGTLR